MSNPTFTVILTGGIASGKSTVANLFKQHRITVIDADQISREVVEPGNAGWISIKEVFGNAFFNADDSLNRKALRKNIFSNPEQRKKLEDLLHPLIRTEITHQLSLADSAYVILDIPLYTENASHYGADRVLVVDLPKKEQIKRLIKRDEITKKDAKKILKVQAPRAKRLELADDIIDNTVTLKQLAQQVDDLHAKYLKLSQH